MTPRHSLIVLCVLAFATAAHTQPVNATARADATIRQTFLLGRSIDGRTITAVETGDPDTQNKTPVVGCIHGNEPAGIAIAKRLISTGLRGQTNGATTPTYRANGSLRAHESCCGAEKRSRRCVWRQTRPP
jgi:hypothetical protein